MALLDCAINKKCCTVDGGRCICPLLSSPPRGICQLKSPQEGRLKRGMTIIPTLRLAEVVTKKIFFRPFGCQFDLKISGGSHEKFYFALLQRTDYTYSP